MRPNKSGCQVASNGKVKSPVVPAAVDVEPAPEPEPEVEEPPPLVFAEGRAAVMEGAVDTAGKSCARASLTRARAAKKLAAAAAMFWLETLTFSSRAFNCASLKISHHLPRR